MGNSCIRNRTNTQQFSFVSGLKLSVKSRSDSPTPMRVLESKPGGATILLIMGKKKHKLRKQSKENEQCMSDSSDDGDASVSRGCPHVSKAISFNNVKKTLKQGAVVGECSVSSPRKLIYWTPIWLYDMHVINCLHVLKEIQTCMYFCNCQMNLYSGSIFRIPICQRDSL